MESDRVQPRIRVLIVDDESQLRVAWGNLIQAQPDMELVDSLDTASALASRVVETKADVVLLDLLMPGKDPVEALKETREARPRTRVVVYTAFSQTGLARRLLTAGAWAMADKLADPLVVLKTLRDAANDKSLPIPSEAESQLDAGRRGIAAPPTSATMPITAAGKNP